MPLQLIRQDITKMDCDAIVNPSNRNLEPTGGADLAIHEAAGPNLYTYTRMLGGCPVGSAKISPTVLLGGNEEYGSWNTICIFVLSERICFAL